MDPSVRQTIEALARHFDDHDDRLGLTPHEQWTLQVLKLAEETGEAAQAVIGARGTNPRKKHIPADWSDVHAEVADVVVTSLVALQRMRPDDAAAYLREQLASKAEKFLPAPAAPAEPRAV
ncbi:MazG-like family protein [Streptomyces chilikensis]|uniref:MazG-like family protein n=1 Tax=Streptomyces chilikensis TaxID=1194079 RepID=UPI000A728C91|nr:MazG-like family protein [Streptomyces chilikensis]